MYEVAPQVLDWLDEGRDVSVARVVALLGVGVERPGDALAWTGDGAVVGGLLSGAVRRVGPEDAPRPRSAVVDRVVSFREARAAGLPCGGRATILVQPATQIPAQVWRLLAAREPVCLVTDLGGGEDGIGRTSWFTIDSIASGHDDAVGGGAVRHAGESVRLFGRGSTRAAVTELADGRQVLAASYWPTPALLIVGAGEIAEALQAVAALLGWTAATVEDVGGLEPVSRLARSDALVVLSHDAELSGSALRAALARPVGYVGALGSRRTQAARARWLSTRGVPADAVRSIHGPAGLDLGARSPAEIAVSIAAEILAVRSGATGGTLRDRPGPVHLDELLGRPWISGSGSAR